jgi:uncharacterized protein involved in exopolysaccharide biosynthesis
MTNARSPGSVRSLVEFVFRQWRIVAWTVGVLLVVAVLYTVVKHRKYTATAAFMSETTKGGANGLSSLAAQLGVGMGEAGSESPQFYVDLISRQSTLRALVDSSYRGNGGTHFRNLVEYFGVSGDSYAVRRDRAVDKLRRILDASANIKTGVVTVRASCDDPELARALVDRTLTLVNTFNLQRRRSRATAERDFVEERLSQAAAELRIAQDRQEQFFQTNAVVTSPRLRLEEDRLSQEVATKRALYSTLTQSYEQARIDAVRDTPVITVIEAPIVPAEPDSRGTVRAIMFALFGGLIVGVVLAYWREAWEQDSTRSIAP